MTATGDITPVPRPGRTLASASQPAVRTRQSRQLRVIFAHLDGTHRFQTAQDLHASLSAAGQRIGLATIYRTLHVLSQSGSVDVITDIHGGMLFRRRRVSRHHHYLICRTCGLGNEITSPAFEQQIAALAATHGFTGIDHRIELFGHCPDCTRAQ
jgi:Fur family transcriptional regulator, ferric uptake regulator